MSNQKEAILAEMGIKPLWRLRVAEPAAASGLSEKQDESQAAQRAAPAVALEDASSLGEPAQASSGREAEEVRPVRFPEHVSPRVDCLLVADGVASLIPQAAKLLDAMLSAIGLKRGENVLLVDAGQAFSVEQIKPRLIVALGQGAARGLLGELDVDECRGRVLRYQDAPLIVSEDPAYLLSHPERKARVWEDLCLAQDQLA